MQHDRATEMHQIGLIPNHLSSSELVRKVFVKDDADQ